MFGVIAGDYVGAGTGGKFVCFVIAQVGQPLDIVEFQSLLILVLAVLQFRAERDHIHRSRRMFPIPGPRPGSRCLRSDRKARRHSVRGSLQLPC